MKTLFPFSEALCQVQTIEINDLCNGRRFLWSSYGRRDRAETRKGHNLLIWLLIRTGIVMNCVLWWSCLLEITLACSSPYSCREAMFLTFDIRWSCSSPIPRSPVEVVEDFGFFQLLARTHTHEMISSQNSMTQLLLFFLISWICFVPFQVQGVMGSMRHWEPMRLST